MSVRVAAIGGAALAAVLLIAGAYARRSPSTAPASPHAPALADELDPVIGFEHATGRLIIAHAAGEPRLDVIETKHDPARRALTTAAGWPRRPVLSPNGAWLALHDQLVDGAVAATTKSRLELYDFATGASKSLVPYRSDRETELALFSPDSSRLLFDTEEGDTTTFHVASLPSLSVSVLSTIPKRARAMVWSAKSDALLFFSQDCLHRAFLDGRPLEKLTCLPSGFRVGASPASISDDGALLAFASETKPCKRVGVVDLTTLTLSWPVPKDRCGNFPKWVPGSRKIAYVQELEAKRLPRIVDLASGEDASLGLDEGVTYGVYPDSDGSVLAVASTSDAPRSVWRLAKGAAPRFVVSTVAPELLAAVKKEAAVPSSVVVRARDGVEVPMVIFRPPGSASEPSKRRHPLVVWVHGGTGGHEDVSPRWTFEIQELVSAGYVVAAPNYRGSTGYGSEWGAAGHTPEGGDDREAKASDILDATAYLRGQPDIDAEHTYLFSVCYGMLIGARALEREAGWYRAGISWDPDSGVAAAMQELAKPARPILTVVTEQNAKALRPDVHADSRKLVLADGHRIVHGANRRRAVATTIDFLAQLTASP